MIADVLVVWCARRRMALVKAKALSLARRRNKGLPAPVTGDYKPGQWRGGPRVARFLRPRSQLSLRL